MSTSLLRRALARSLSVLVATPLALAQGSGPLRSVEVTLRDVVDEDVEQRLELFDLSFVVTLDAAAGADVLGLALEVPGLSLPRFSGDTVFDEAEHGVSGSVYAETEDDDGDGVLQWYIGLQRAEALALTGGDLVVETFGERSSARFVAPLAPLPGAAPTRALVTAPAPGASLRAGDTVTIVMDAAAGDTSVSIETIDGPQRDLDLAELQTEGATTFVVPSGLYGGVRVMTVREVSDESVRDNVTVTRTVGAVAARWFVLEGDVLADLTQLEAESGVAMFDHWLADPLGLTLGSFARVPVEGGFVHVFGSGATTFAEVHRVKEHVAFLLRDVPGAAPNWQKRELRAALGAAKLAFVVAYDGEAREAVSAVEALGLTAAHVDAGALFVEGSYEYLASTMFDSTFDGLLTAMMVCAATAQAVPLYAEVEAAMAAARERGVYTPAEDVVLPVGLYLATLSEVAFGLWSGKANDAGRVFDGMYGCSERSELAAADPDGAAVVSGFLGDRLDVLTFIDEGFEGDFHLDARADLPYTQRSQYLTRARLRGFFDCGLVGNSFDNELGGNAGRNRLVGGAGRDVAVFQGAVLEYQIELVDGAARVTDSVDGRDGQDLCLGVEVLRFRDGEVIVPGGQ